MDAVSILLSAMRATEKGGDTVVHELKILPGYYDAVVSGVKSFELRKADRPFAVGDRLRLREFRDGLFTGRKADFEVVYILPGGSYGLAADYCVMSIKPCTT